MSAPSRRRPSAAPAFRAGASGCPRLALCYARNLHAATDRGLPEAAALAQWVSSHAASLGLPEAQVPEEPPSRFRSGGVGAEAWRKLGRVLRGAAARVSDHEDSVAAGWLRARAAALDLDPVEIAIAGLALR
jgi:hypothetical protein